jgi:hypothetical protein
MQHHVRLSLWQMCSHDKHHTDGRAAASGGKLLGTLSAYQAPPSAADLLRCVLGEGGLSGVCCMRNKQPRLT